MGILSMFGSRNFDPEQFERQLKQITINITKTERDIQRLTADGKKIRRITLFYLIMIYLIYTTFIVTTKNLRIENLVAMMVSPVLIFLVYKSSKIINSKRISYKESRLVRLRETHENKINELKNLTNFNKTQNLLLKFSNGENIEYLMKEEEELIKRQKTRLEKLEKNRLNNTNDISKTLEEEDLNWYDKLMRFILGNDEFDPKNRYALICFNCFNHNGLAFPNQLPAEVKYICPHCGMLNGGEKVVFPEETLVDNEAGAINDTPNDIPSDTPSDTPTNTPNEVSDDIATEPQSVVNQEEPNDFEETVTTENITSSSGNNFKAGEDTSRKRK